MKRQSLADCDRIVVKIGSSLLGDDRSETMEPLVRQVARFREQGRHLAMVSSGAIFFGMNSLGETEYPQTLPRKQAMAAVGQSELMDFYQGLFTNFGLRTAQVLLTQQGIHNRQTYLNASNTLNTLLDMGTIPIINENDTEATEEIQFGDNDTLSALVATLIDADLLIILTDVDGLYRRSDEEDDELVETVDHVDDRVKSWAGQSGDKEASVGGMATKLEAAETITQAGTPMVIASGRKTNVLESIIDGKKIGTFFKPKSGSDAVRGRKRWIGYHLPAKGSVTVDSGALDALTHGGKSLLPSGVVSTTGQFNRGDAIRLLSKEGNEFARGLSNYKVDEVDSLKGCHTSEISDILGYHDYDEIIHRDNLVIFPNDNHAN
jgi:glutamate 5-kinase